MQFKKMYVLFNFLVLASAFCFRGNVRVVVGVIVFMCGEKYW